MEDCEDFLFLLRVWFMIFSMVFFFFSSFLLSFQLSKIGQGAFGETYIAEDIETRMKVAIKTEASDKKKQMLRAEAAILRSLQGSLFFFLLLRDNQSLLIIKPLLHTGKPHVCQYYGCGRHQGYNFIVMELLGHNLSQFRRVQPKNQFPVSVTAILGLEMLGAIETLHENGFLHRDVKPVSFISFVFVEFLFFLN